MTPNQDERHDETVEQSFSGEIRDFTAAVHQSQFEKMAESRHISVIDYTGMGNMSEFDVYVSYRVTDVE